MVSRFRRTPRDAYNPSKINVGSDIRFPPSEAYDTGDDQTVMYVAPPSSRLASSLKMSPSHIFISPTGYKGYSTHPSYHPSHLTHTVIHEGLHQALNKIGEKQASYKIDSPRLSGYGYETSPSGLLNAAIIFKRMEERRDLIKRLSARRLSR